MADPVRRPKQEDSAKRSSPGETPGSQDKNTMDSDKTGLSSSTEENSTPESSPSCDARVASIQKRVVAELLDFLFLYFTKFLVFSIFYNNMERFTQLQYSLIIDENTSLKELEEILIQALTYRLMVFMYETLIIINIITSIIILPSFSSHNYYHDYLPSPPYYHYHHMKLSS
ncbi:predicted protein [Nematostella vectensis]|uniref:RDD domain-containing protein n=1 Tax=Nematostella vectensis TaxID=45351 RepID=A7T9X4_NEMVE|nr:predicted protein [Nematostella vectensis]|eukprot:XP_001619299.1 hypothetical protein NEMVEDRAFT_v1g224322 [Nematostella vectensis]